MVYLEINKKNYHNLIDKVNNHLSNKDAKIFILIYMEGCGPCNETRPEWSKLKNIISNHLKNITIVSIDKDLFGKLKHAGKEPMSFPTIRFMTNAGENVETYEDSRISNKDRKIDSFVEWIKLKTGKNSITKSDEKHHNKTYSKRRNNKTHKKYRKHFGGKWSAKYKRSINCKRPRGFSQKQYCKYGRNK